MVLMAILGSFRILDLSPLAQLIPLINASPVVLGNKFPAPA